MVEFILLLLLIFWLLGFIQIPILNFMLLSIGGQPITINTILVLALLIVIVNFLPGIFRTIAIILLILWLFSLFGFLSGFGNLIILIFILAVIFSLI